MYHYDKLSDYQSVAKEVKRNDDTMILFSKKKTFSSVNREDSLQSLLVT